MKIPNFSQFFVKKKGTQKIYIEAKKKIKTTNP